MAHFEPNDTQSDDKRLPDGELKLFVLVSHPL